MTPDSRPEGLYHILAADIGGTNSRFAHFQVTGGGVLRLVAQIWLQTREADSFDRLFHILSASTFPFDTRYADMVAIAIAGPVIEGVRSRPPLIPWEIDISHFRDRYGFQHTILLNDFIAQAYACLSPIGKSADAVLPGTADAGSTIAVIGAGTGLGKAILIPDGRGGHLAVPSEGAHAGFPFTGDTEWAFQRFLVDRGRMPYATYNHVVSGNGLRALHLFRTGMDLEPAAIAGQFARHTETLIWFARLYGRACRNFALETLALGGVYITGGIAAQNPGILFHEAFARAFLDSETMHHLLSRIPVHLIKDQDSGLWGAAFMAARTLQQGAPRNS